MDLDLLPAAECFLRVQLLLEFLSVHATNICNYYVSSCTCMYSGVLSINVILPFSLRSVLSFILEES